MVDKRITKKQIDKNINDQAELKRIFVEKNWLKGNKTSMERDILAASIK
ncbi:MAG: hypothetical protein PHP82_03345 [Candidatus ainarchaeum sp.]|nr:hypothetical protein [Candidatus ainarchaeum sp.]